MARRIRRFYESEYWQDDPSCAERVPTSPQLLIRVADGGDVSRFVLPPEPEFSVTDTPRTIRATDFRALLQDPYGFALSCLRGCESIDDHARELDGARFGSLAHAVLERFGRDQGRVHVTDASAVAARLDELLDARVDELFGRGARYARVAVRIQVEQLRARLHRFAAWHVRWISDGWQVRGVEVSTPEDGIALEVDDQTVGITARIDRVDYHEERDEWALLDYKTADQATDPRKSHGPGESGWRDLQLPLYHWIFPQLSDASESPRLSVSQGSRVLLGYVTLSRDSDLVQEAMADWTNEELTDAVDAARDAIRRHTRETIRFSEREVPRFADVRLRALLGLSQLGSRDEVDE